MRAIRIAEESTMGTKCKDDVRGNQEETVAIKISAQEGITGMVQNKNGKRRRKNGE